MGFFEKVSRKIDWILYNRLVFDKEAFKVNNIFNYNYTINRRRSAYVENCPANVMYSMGYNLRRYSGYKGRVYAGTEHAIPNLRLSNADEYRDVPAPVVLVSCSERRELLSHHTDKLMFTMGPSFVPYVEGIYTPFAIQEIKKSMGKTLLVFPHHANDASTYEGFMENINEQIEYVKQLQKEHGFQTVIASLYYVDIERGLAPLFEKEGWVVVSTGHQRNYDFGDCMKTIYELADVIVTQGMTGVPYATYWNKPVIYKKTDESLILSDGSKIPEWDYVAPIANELTELFGQYHEDITEEQIAYCNRRWGLNETQTPENLKLILEFAKDIRKIYKDDKKVLKLASKAKYLPIKDQVETAVRIRKENYNV